MTNENKPHPRQQIIDSFLSALKNGDSAFAYPFEAGEIRVPVNGVSGKAYSSINRLILTDRGETDPRWLTKNQVEEQNYQVKDFAKPRKLIFWEFSQEVPAYNTDGSPRLNNIGNQVMETIRRDRPLMRTYAVYHARDLLTHDGHDLPPYQVPAPERSPVERVTDILANSGVTIRHDPSPNAAIYKRSIDTIILPEPGLVSEEEYYAQAIEELVSWTGHPDRLGWRGNRESEAQTIQGDIQETLAKAMIAQDLGLKISQPLINQASVRYWESHLQKDLEMLFRAATQADNVRLYIMSQERMQVQEVNAQLSPRQPTSFFSQGFRPAGPEDRPEQGAWIRTIDDSQATVFAVVSGRDDSIVSTFDSREASVTEANALNLGVKPSLKYSSDVVTLDVPFEEKEMVKTLGATWSRQNSTWCARPGVELSKLGRWIPANDLDRPGLIEPDLNDRLRLSVPYKHRQEAKDLGAFFDNQKSSWVTSINNKNLDELTKKFPPQREQEISPEQAAEVAAVPEIATERVVLAVPFEEKNLAKAAGAKWDRDEKVWVAEPGADLARLSQWIPEREPEPEMVLAASAEFAKVLDKAGFQLDEPPKMDGKIYRVSIQDGKPNARDGAYYATMNGGHPNGWLKNHKSGEYQAWIYTGQEMTVPGKETQKDHAAARQKAKEDKAETLSIAKWNTGLDVAREFAEQIDGLTSTNDLLKNPFLEVAGINAVGGVRRDDDGNLLVPGVNIEGRLQTIQTISPNGEMHFEKGGNRVGAMCVIDGFDIISKPDINAGLPLFRAKYADHNPEYLSNDLLIAEDFATGASLHMATNLPVIVAFSPDNISKVAVAVQNKYPEANLLICANNHPERASNLCLKKAEEAAKKVSGKLVIPEFSEMEQRAGLGSFNDLHKIAGLEAVSKAVNQARRQDQSKSAGPSR